MAHVYSGLVREKEIPLHKRLVIRILHKLGLYDVKAFTKDTGLGPIYFYYGYCNTHGYFVDHPHGTDERLSCPECENKKPKSPIDQN